MNRAGRSLPTGPATTPHASSGWSRRACATIASWVAWSMVSTGPEYWSAHPRPDDGVLHAGQVRIDRARHGRRVVRVEVVVVVLGDPDPCADRQPHVVEHPQPALDRIRLE